MFKEDYDPEEDILFINITNRDYKDYDHSLAYDGIIVDLDKKGQFLGIEIHHLSYRMEE